MKISIYRYENRGIISIFNIIQKYLFKRKEKFSNKKENEREKKEMMKKDLIYKREEYIISFENELDIKRFIYYEMIDIDELNFELKINQEYKMIEDFDEGFFIEIYSEEEKKSDEIMKNYRRIRYNMN